MDARAARRDIPQYVRSESSSPSQLLSLSLILVFLFLPLVALPSFIPSSTFLPAESITPTTDAQRRSFSILTNITAGAAHAILHLRLLHNWSRPGVAESFSFELSSVYYDHGRIARVRDVGWKADFEFNQSFVPICFIDSGAFDSVLVSVTGDCKHMWIEYVFWQWEIGSSVALLTAQWLNFVMFLVMGFASAARAVSTRNRPASTRSRFVGWIVVLHFASHFPFDVFVRFRLARLLGRVIWSAAFGLLYVLWLLKVVGFDVDRVKRSDDFRTVTIGCAMAVALAFKAVTGELQLLTWPRLYDGGNQKEEDFLGRNYVAIICAYAFYLLAIEAIDRLERLEADEQWGFFADNFLALWAGVVNTVIAVNHRKTKDIVEHPLRSQAVAVLWDFVVLYEVFASAPVQRDPANGLLDEGEEDEIVIDKESQ
jgi:uncharacterized membrane protein